MEKRGKSHQQQPPQPGTLGVSAMPKWPGSLSGSGTGVDVTRMRTPCCDEVWGLHGGDGRRVGEQTQRECPFGEEQKNPLALLVFLPPICTSYRAYHSGAVGYEQPSPAKTLVFLGAAWNYSVHKHGHFLQRLHSTTTFSACMCCLQNVELVSKINSSQRGFNRVCCFPEEIDCKQTVSCSYFKQILVQLFSFLA